jgi:hypothetical protein
MVVLRSGRIARWQRQRDPGQCRRSTGWMAGTPASGFDAGRGHARRSAIIVE